MLNQITNVNTEIADVHPCTFASAMTDWNKNKTIKRTAANILDLTKQTELRGLCSDNVSLLQHKLLSCLRGKFTKGWWTMIS